MKSGLIESITLKPDTSVSARLYVTNCLSRVFDVVAQRRAKTGLSELILHDDNARPYRAWIMTEYLADKRVESYPNPLYSPDLNLCNFFLFQKLKNQRQGIQFNNDKKIFEALGMQLSVRLKRTFELFR